MPLGPHQKTWARLDEALAALAKTCGGSFAFVLDAGNGLWCIGLADPEPTLTATERDRAADRFYAKEMVPRLPATRRGERFEVVKVEGDDRYVAVSFAGIYAVVVWFEAPLDPFLVRTKIRQAIPDIEALTLSLPPSGGPGHDAGAAKVRA